MATNPPSRPHPLDLIESFSLKFTKKQNFEPKETNEGNWNYVYMKFVLVAVIQTWH